LSYFQSITRNEIAWTHRYGKAMKPDFPHSVLELGIQHSNEYLKLLETYLLLTPHLLPKDAAHPLNQPTLRHPNLTPSNIFILPETGRISCLVNWQHAIIQPLALVAGYPHSFENPDAILPDLDSMPKFIAREEAGRGAR
jgi:hypothetical protein